MRGCLPIQVAGAHRIVVAKYDVLCELYLRITGGADEPTLEEVLAWLRGVHARETVAQAAAAGQPHLGTAGAGDVL